MHFFFNILIDLALLAIPLFYIKFIEKKELRPSSLGFNFSPLKKDLVLCTKIFFVLVIYSIILSIIFSIFAANDLYKVESAIESILNVSPLALAYFMVVRVIAEEIFFRAFLVARIGIFGSSVAFGLAHLTYGSAAEFLGAIGLGLILAVAYKENKSIAPNIVAHMLYNAFALFAFIAV